MLQLVNLVTTLPFESWPNDLKPWKRLGGVSTGELFLP